MRTFAGSGRTGGAGKHVAPSLVWEEVLLQDPLR